MTAALAGCGDLDHGGTGPADPESPVGTSGNASDAGATISTLDASPTLAPDASAPPAVDSGPAPIIDAAPLPPPTPPPDPPDDKKGPGKH